MPNDLRCPTCGTGLNDSTRHCACGLYAEWACESHCRTRFFLPAAGDSEGKTPICGVCWGDGLNLELTKIGAYFGEGISLTAAVVDAAEAHIRGLPLLKQTALCQRCGKHEDDHPVKGCLVFHPGLWRSKASFDGNTSNPQICKCGHHASEHALDSLSTRAHCRTCTNNKFHEYDGRY